MKINGCGLDVVVSQQFLYRVQVCSLFQQVCGKGVAQHVYVYTVFDACTMCGFFQYFHQCTCRILLSGCFALKQPFLWTIFPKVVP